jgi:hypothetical protein
MMTTKYENYVTGDDYNYPFYGSYWIAQTFTVGATGHTITSVKLLLSRYGSPGTVTVSIRAVDENGHPTGDDLTSGTTDGNTLPVMDGGELREITLTEIDYSANTKCAIVVRALDGNGSNQLIWRQDTSSPSYAGGNQERSSNSGSTWAAQTDQDQIFEIWGNPIVPTEVNVADTVSGTETDLGVGPLMSDAGSGIETSLGLNVNLTMSETSSGIETLAMTGTFGVTDASNAAIDTIILQGTVPVSDSSAGVEAAPSVNVSFTVSESGSDIEAESLTAYLTPADSGYGWETQYGGLTTYFFIYDASAFAVETISTPGTIVVLEEGLFAEFAWCTKPTSPMIDDLALPHVQSIIISDVASMSDKKVQGGSLPRRKMVGKEGRKVTIEGWTDEQSDIDILEALMNGATRTFYHPSGDSFAVLVTAFNPNLRVDEFDRRIYSLTLAEK